MGDTRKPAPGAGSCPLATADWEPAPHSGEGWFPESPPSDPQAAPDANFERVTVRFSTLPPEVRGLVARTRNRAALVREALAWYCRQGEFLARVAAGVERLETALADVSARLAAIEARLAAGVPVAAAPAPAQEAPDLVRRQTAALAAWVTDD